jgi:basic amino acid/polyamine antiporter, APA family
MARLQLSGLRRAVGVPGLFATAYGNVGSSIYYALGLVALHALGLTPVVFMVAGVLFALTAKTYAEGAAMFPEAGGASSFARHAFNEVASFFAGWALTLDYIITIAISAIFVPHYLGAFFPALTHSPGDVIGGVVVIVVLAALNIRGIGESANLNLVLAVLDLATQVLLVLLGLFLVLNPTLLVNQVHLGSAPSWSQLIFALSVATVAYTGIETVSNMAEEARDPGRDVPRAVNLVVIAVLGVYAGMSVIALSALPVVHTAHGYTTALGTRFENDPVLGVIGAFGLHGTVLTILKSYVGVLAATILFIATNAGLIGISRLCWSLGEHRQLPAIFSRLHSRHNTPWFTIVTFSGLAICLLLPSLGLIPSGRETNFLGNLYSFGAMLSFTTAHVSVVALRIKLPERDRPYRLPFNVRVRGALIPLTAVVGGLGTFAAWVSVVILHSEARAVGLPWMALGLIGYVVYRRRQGLDPRATYRLPRREPPFEKALDYRSALVPLFGRDIDADVMHRAAKLVGEGAVIDAVYLLHVPSRQALEAPLPEEERAAATVLEVARLEGRRAGLSVRTRVIRTRHPGASIVEAAGAREVEIIYLADEHAPPSERGLGPLALYLLQQRPCRIVLDHAPVTDGPREVAQSARGRR